MDVVSATSSSYLKPLNCIFVILDHSNWPKAVVNPCHNLYCFLSVVTKLVKLKLKLIGNRNYIGV